MTAATGIVGLALSLTAAPAAGAVADRIAACVDAGETGCVGRETRACLDARPDDSLAVAVPDCLEAEYRGWQALVDRWWHEDRAGAAERAAHRAWIARREDDCTKPGRLGARVPLELVLALEWQCRRDLTAARAIELHEARQ